MSCPPFFPSHIFLLVTVRNDLFRDKKKWLLYSERLLKNCFLITGTGEFCTKYEQGHNKLQNVVFSKRVIVNGHSLFIVLA